jgi:hypothetical protein
MVMTGMPAGLRPDSEQPVIAAGMRDNSTSGVVCEARVQASGAITFIVLEASGGHIVTKDPASTMAKATCGRLMRSIT